MNVIPRGDGLDTKKPWMPLHRRQDKVPTQPGLLDRDRHEGHPHVKCDSRSLRQNLDRAAGLYSGAHPFEQSPHRAWLACKLLAKRSHRATEMRLIPVGEAPYTLRTMPER